MQSFRSIREGGFLYVDKTETIHRLVRSRKYYFLSRPRRFGKSLLVDTIGELFSGSQELFEGLWIEKQWDWSRIHPVIHFNFAGLGIRTLGLEAAIYRGLADNAARLGVSLTDTSYDQQFKELIDKASQFGQVVILIDEYDKPVTDYLDDLQTVVSNRSVMKSFYSVLKELDGKIRFLFLTGVSRFSRESIFSDLNNLEDITINDQFHTLVGITQRELERDFADELSEMRRDDLDILTKVKDWYNGYSWGGTEKLYNPFSLLNLMKSRKFHNFWFATGTPTFLFGQLKKNKLGDMDGVQASANKLAEFNTDRLDMVSLLFQTGYLTIKEVKGGGRLFVLGYPNLEVKESLLEGLLDVYREPVVGDSLGLVVDLRMAFEGGNVKGVIEQLNSLIGQIPYDHWNAEKESIFTIITVLTFKLAGVEVQTEVHSSKGRCDVLVKTEDYIYLMELKLDGTAQDAVDQIFEKRYLEPYQADKRKKIAIGIAFSSADRQISEYLVMESQT